MTDEHVIQVVPRESRAVFRWDPANPEAVANARHEFERLQRDGYVLFALTEQPGTSIERRAAGFEASSGSFVARSPAPTRTEVFSPDATRIVAVRPMRGG